MTKLSICGIICNKYKKHTITKERTKMTKIDLITGILGSGKTTFLLGYARHLTAQGKKIAILENDFGAVNVDMLMLQELQGENCQLEMVSGGCDPDCHKRRFKTQLIALGMQHLDRVIIEPSGIFDMDEFFDILHESPLDKWFETGSIITIADAGMEEELSDQMEYLLASEAAYCGKLLLSKTEQHGDMTHEEAAERTAAHINRALADIKCDRTIKPSDIYPKGLTELTDADYTALENAGYRGSAYIKKYLPEDIQSTVHYFMNIRMEDAHIPELLSGIFNDSRCGKIYRIKGSLPTSGGGWIKINSTPSKLETDLMEKGQSVLIVIGDGIDKSAVDAHISAVNTDPEYVSI